MNSVPMILRLASGSLTPCELVEEAVLGLDGHERDLERVAERRDDLVALVLAHQAVVDEDAGQLVADRLVDEQRRHARVDAAGEPADDLARPRPARGCGAIWSSTIEAALHVMSQPQTSPRNVLRMSCPKGVWTTSGWNWIP